MDFSPLRKHRFQKKSTSNLLKAYPFSCMKILPAQGIKFEILNKKLNNKHFNNKHATYNKDNKSNLFVTVFAASCSEPGNCKLAVPGCPHLPPSKSCTGSYYRLRLCLYRDTAPGGFDHVHRDRLKSCLPSGLYRDYTSSEPICTMTAKTAPCIRSLQP
jgi:hypothetical protein